MWCILKEQYIEFFEALPKTAQLTLKMLVPNKYETLNTEIFSCVCIQQGIIKKIVRDNLKECTDKIVNNIVKQKPEEKKVLKEFTDMDISDEFEILLDNYFYFKNTYSDRVNSDILVCYISYLLTTQQNLKSFKLFENCLYVKAKQKVLDELLSSINNCVGNKISTELTAYGSYLTNPITITAYECFGREQEIKDCVTTLCRMNKSNIILTGNTGVGKTSVVYGICNYIQSEDCPQKLRGKFVFSLDINKVLSGTMYRGDLEKRLELIIDELETHPDIILFIDEIHILFNKHSDGNNSISVKDVLKPYLTTDSKVIGCTTEAEYHIIEQDTAFERRFQKIHINEPNKQQSLHILLSVKNKYETYHNVVISEDVCQHIIDGCSTKLLNKQFPDKALDILDRCCVYSCLNNVELDKEVVNICLQTSIDKGLQKQYDITNIKKELKDVIVGQDNQINSVCNFIKRYQYKLNDTSKPIACLLFVGPTGTGKTELCKQIAKKVFTEESFIRLDMTEFKEPHSISKLIGSPPGYVGYDNGGYLTEKIKHNPFSIVLFDEIEKAHIDVINTLLQIMDDGRLTDNNGVTVDFRNCLIVMTSNIGCSTYVHKNTIGFTENKKDYSVIKNAIHEFFPPEFISRLDEIITFNVIELATFEKILRKRLNEFICQYEKAFAITITIPEVTIQKMIELWYNEQNGARFIRTNIHNIIGNLFLSEDLEPSMSVCVLYKDDNFYLEVSR